MPYDIGLKALDAAVEAAYDVDFDGDEEKIAANLFKLYVETASCQGTDDVREWGGILNRKRSGVDVA